MVSPNNTNSLGESSDILLGKLLQHYVDDMFAFQHDLVNEDDYFNREEQCLDRLESIKATIVGDVEEIAICVDRAHTLIEFLQTEEEFPEKFHIGMVTASILTLEPLMTAVAEDADCTDYLMSFVNREAPLNEVQASQWSRVLVHLIAHSLPAKFFVQNDSLHLQQLCMHLTSPSILNLLSFIIGVDPDSDRAQLLNFYVCDSRLIQLLTDALHAHCDDQIFLSNLCTLLSTIVGAFSSLPSFACRFRDGLAPLCAVLFDILQRHTALPSACIAHCMGLLGDLIKYDVRACKYEQLCSTRGSASTPTQAAETGSRFVTSMFEHVEVLLMLVQQTRGLVLLRSCEALGAALSCSPMLGTVDQVLSHDIIAIIWEVFVSYRANEWVRHSCLDTFRTILRGGAQFNQLREAIFSTPILSAVPALYWNKPQITRLRALGHMADLCTELVNAAPAHPSVRDRLRNHVQWAKVLSFYGGTQQDDLQCGLDVDHMCSLFGQVNALAPTAMLSASSSPRRCFMSPARSPGMSDSERMSSSQSQEQEYFDAGHKDEDPVPEDEDSEVRLVAEQLQSTELAPSDADLVHERTPIRMHRPGSKMMNSMLNNEEKENSPPPELQLPEGDEDDTPKKMIIDHQSVRNASAMGDTPQPKLISVSARSRTFYSREAKSKSPFGKVASKDEDTDMPLEVGSIIAKKLF